MAWDKGGIRMDTNNSNGVVDNNVQQNQNAGANVPKTFDEMLKESNYQEVEELLIKQGIGICKTNNLKQCFFK